MHYYDPMFYICSDEMPFGIRIEVTLKYEINPNMLEKAVNTAIKRYPYFAIKLAEKDGNIIAVPNDFPIVVYKDGKVLPLGCKELNYHMLALSYVDKKINFYVTHVITDGCGFVPFMKTVLYYYLCEFLGCELPSDSIRLSDEPLLDGETANPYPEELMKNAKPFYVAPNKEYFRLTEGGYVTDDVRISYNFGAKESDVMKFSHENDASPCALFSSIMAKAIWDVHPDVTKDLVSAVSFNMRGGLQCLNNYRMLCNALLVRYPKQLNNSIVRKICTCTRGSIMAQSQSENSLFFAQQKRKMLESILELPDVNSKRETLSKIALDDSTDNTFSVSYVGRIDYGALQEHIDCVRNFTDGSTYRTVFIEISSFKGWFYISMQQGFSNDVYYRALLKQLKENDIEFIEDGKTLMNTPDIILP